MENKQKKLFYIGGAVVAVLIVVVAALTQTGNLFKGQLTPVTETGRASVNTGSTVTGQVGLRSGVTVSNNQVNVDPNAMGDNKNLSFYLSAPVEEAAVVEADTTNENLYRSYNGFTVTAEKRDRNVVVTLPSNVNSALSTYSGSINRLVSFTLSGNGNSEVYGETGYTYNSANATVTLTDGDRFVSSNGNVSYTIKAQSNYYFIRDNGFSFKITSGGFNVAGLTTDVNSGNTIDADAIRNSNLRNSNLLNSGIAPQSEALQVAPKNNISELSNSSPSTLIDTTAPVTVINNDSASGAVDNPTFDPTSNTSGIAPTTDTVAPSTAPTRGRESSAALFGQANLFFDTAYAVTTVQCTATGNTFTCDFSQLTTPGTYHVVAKTPQGDVNIVVIVQAGKVSCLYDENSFKLQPSLIVMKKSEINAPQEIKTLLTYQLPPALTGCDPFTSGGLNLGARIKTLKTPSAYLYNTITDFNDWKPILGVFDTSNNQVNVLHKKFIDIVRDFYTGDLNKTPGKYLYETVDQNGTFVVSDLQLKICDDDLSGDKLYHALIDSDGNETTYAKGFTFASGKTSAVVKVQPTACSELMNTFIVDETGTSAYDATQTLGLVTKVDGNDISMDFGKFISNVVPKDGKDHKYFIYSMLNKPQATKVSEIPFVVKAGAGVCAPFSYTLNGKPVGANNEVIKDSSTVNKNVVLGSPVVDLNCIGGAKVLGPDGKDLGLKLDATTYAFNQFSAFGTPLYALTPQQLAVVQADPSKLDTNQFYLAFDNYTSSAKTEKYGDIFKKQTGTYRYIVYDKSTPAKELSLIPIRYTGALDCKSAIGFDPSHMTLDRLAPKDGTFHITKPVSPCLEGMEIKDPSGKVITQNFVLDPDKANSFFQIVGSDADQNYKFVVGDKANVDKLFPVDGDYTVKTLYSDNGVLKPNDDTFTIVVKTGNQPLACNSALQKEGLYTAMKDADGSATTYANGFHLKAGDGKTQISTSIASGYCQTLVARIVHDSNPTQVAYSTQKLHQFRTFDINNKVIVYNLDDFIKTTVPKENGTYKYRIDTFASEIDPASKVLASIPLTVVVGDQQPPASCSGTVNFTVNGQVNNAANPVAKNPTNIAQDVIFDVPASILNCDVTPVFKDPNGVDLKFDLKVPSTYGFIQGVVETPASYKDTTAYKSFPLMTAAEKAVLKYSETRFGLAFDNYTSVAKAAKYSAWFTTEGVYKLEFQDQKDPTKSLATFYIDYKKQAQASTCKAVTFSTNGKTIDQNNPIVKNSNNINQWNAVQISDPTGLAEGCNTDIKVLGPDGANVNWNLSPDGQNGGYSFIQLLYDGKPTHLLTAAEKAAMVSSKISTNNIVLAFDNFTSAAKNQTYGDIMKSKPGMYKFIATDTSNNNVVTTIYFKFDDSVIVPPGPADCKAAVNFNPNYIAVTRGVLGNTSLTITNVPNCPFTPVMINPQGVDVTNKFIIDPSKAGSLIQIDPTQPNDDTKYIVLFDPNTFNAQYPTDGVYTLKFQYEAGKFNDGTLKIDVKPGQNNDNDNNDNNDKPYGFNDGASFDAATGALAEKMKNAGIMTGDANGNFNPNQLVKRYEAALILTRVLNINTNKVCLTTSISAIDVDTSASYFADLCKAFGAKVIEGYKVTPPVMKPSAPVTPREFFKMIYNSYIVTGKAPAVGNYTGVSNLLGFKVTPDNDWFGFATQFVSQFFTEGELKSIYGNFDLPLTRIQVAQLIDRSFPGL